MEHARNQGRLSRRDVLRLGATATAGMYVATREGWRPTAAHAVPLAVGLSDPATQPIFVEQAPNALDPGFLYRDLNENGGPAAKPDFRIRAGQARQRTGLVDPRNGRRLSTAVWGYGDSTVSWCARSMVPTLRFCSPKAIRLGRDPAGRVQQGAGRGPGCGGTATARSTGRPPSSARPIREVPPRAQPQARPPQSGPPSRFRAH